MTWLSELVHRLRETLSRRREDAELDEEIRYHLELETERLVRSGMSPDVARH